MSIPIVSHSVSGLRHIARAVRERADNPFYMLLMRFLWGRRPWWSLIATLALLNAATFAIHWLSNRWVVSLMSSPPGMMRSPTLFTALVNGYSSLLSIFSPMILLSIWMARRLREFLSTPMLREPLELVPNSRASLADAWAGHWAALAILLPLVSHVFRCIYPLYAYFSADMTSPYKTMSNRSLIHFLLTGYGHAARPFAHMLLLVALEWAARIFMVALGFHILVAIQLRIRRPLLGVVAAILAQSLASYAVQAFSLLLMIADVRWRFLRDTSEGGIWVSQGVMELVLSWMTTLLNIAVSLPACAWLWDFSRRRFIERPLPVEPACGGGGSSSAPGGSAGTVQCAGKILRETPKPPESQARCPCCQ